MTKFNIGDKVKIIDNTGLDFIISDLSYEYSHSILYIRLKECSRAGWLNANRFISLKKKHERNLPSWF